MKTISVKLVSGQEIILDPEDLPNLKIIIDRALANLDENLYQHLLRSNPSEIVETLEKMSELQLIELLKEDIKENPLKWHHVPSFTQKILSEIFKKNSLGYKQLRRLSQVQRKFLEKLGFTTR